MLGIGGILVKMTDLGILLIFSMLFIVCVCVNYEFLYGIKDLFKY